MNVGHSGKFEEEPSGSKQAGGAIQGQLMSQGKEFPRRFVPENIDLGNWPSIEVLYQSLHARLINSAAELEQWLLDRSELDSCLDEEYQKRYIKTTLDVNNAVDKQAFLDFDKQVNEPAQEWGDKLDRKYLACPFKSALDQEHYLTFNRSTEARVSIFRPENPALNTQCTELGTKYEEITGSLMLTVDGKPYTMAEVNVLFEEPDRALRQRAWEAIVAKRLELGDELDQLYDKQVTLRSQTARNAGFANYRDYFFVENERFDYTPQDCFAFHAAVEQLILPVVRGLHAERERQLQISPLRPWDLDVDPLGRPPFKPFNTAEELTDGVSRIMQRISPELAAMFNDMLVHSELDVMSRPCKAPGAYSVSLEERRRPFICMDAAGLHDDVMTLIHELGHSFHTLLSRHEPLLCRRQVPPFEFAEVASQGLELIGLEHLAEFYSTEEVKRAKTKTLESSVLTLFPWISRVDAFQHWVYTNPEHSHEERTAKWLELAKRFDSGIDWSGSEQYQALNWQRQSHIFVSPFYYIEYGISEIGALRLWLNYRQDPKIAMEQYCYALSLGNSRPLPELFRAAGIPWDFSAAAIRPLVDEVAKELERCRA